MKHDGYFLSLYLIYAIYNYSSLVVPVWLLVSMQDLRTHPIPTSLAMPGVILHSCSLLLVPLCSFLDLLAVLVLYEKMSAC